MTTDSPMDVVITDRVVDLDEEDSVFGKRWGGQVFRLSEEDLRSLRQGRFLALDVQGEYVVYLTTAPEEEPSRD